MNLRYVGEKQVPVLVVGDKVHARAAEGVVLPGKITKCVTDATTSAPVDFLYEVDFGSATQKVLRRHMFGYHFPETAVAAAVAEAERSGLPLEVSSGVTPPRTENLPSDKSDDSKLDEAEDRAVLITAKSDVDPEGRSREDEEEMILADEKTSEGEDEGANDENIDSIDDLESQGEIDSAESAG